MAHKTIGLDTNLNYFPTSKYKKFCRILNDVWTNAAEKILKRDKSGPRFTLDDINMFKASKNPAEEMIEAWKTDNITFRDLLEVLEGSECLRCASFIKGILPEETRTMQDGPAHSEEISFEVSYKTVALWTNNFDNHHYIASGGFADVFKGKKKSNEIVAVKRFKALDNEEMMMFTNEVSVLSRCNHPNLLRLLHCSNAAIKCLVYEYMDNGCLFDHLRDEVIMATFPMVLRANVSKQTAAGLSYLHSQQIVHRDIKSSNILLNKLLNVKIGDFGITRAMPASDSSHQVTQTLVGTTVYMAPEYLRFREISIKIDMYSFGVVLAELLEGCTAFDERRQGNNILEMLEDDAGPDKNVEPQSANIFQTLKKLAISLTSSDKYKRPTADLAEKTLGECIIDCR